MALGINTVNNSSSLFAINAMRLNNLALGIANAQLSSGKRIVNSAIDPSGLAISQGFQARLGGLDQATYNAQDTINLTRTADSTLSTQGDILNRMRDLAVRSSNSATLSDADKTRLNQEYQSLKSELTRSGQTASFNGKKLTTDVAADQYGTQSAQVGPDNSADARIDVTIDPSTAASMGLAASDISAAGDANAAIDEVSAAIDQVSSQRADLGITERRLGYTVNDLASQSINLAASNSTIADADIARTITERTTSQVLSQLSLTALRQSNAQALGALSLIRNS